MDAHDDLTLSLTCSDDDDTHGRWSFISPPTCHGALAGSVHIQLVNRIVFIFYNGSSFPLPMLALLQNMSSHGSSVFLLREDQAILLFAFSVYNKKRR